MYSLFPKYVFCFLFCGLGMGLMVDHRNVSHWGLSAFHQEFRRRIWANIYILDAYQSVVYGRPPVIQDAECDVVIPLPPIPSLQIHIRTSVTHLFTVPDFPCPLLMIRTPHPLPSTMQIWHPTCPSPSSATAVLRKWTSIYHTTNSAA